MELCPDCLIEIEGTGMCPYCDCWANTERTRPVLPGVGDRLGEGFRMVGGNYEDMGGLFVDGDEYSPWEGDDELL